MIPSKPIAITDLETTGVDLAHDRIIELSISYWGLTAHHKFRFNPGREISKEATAVHGLTIEDLRNEKTFEEEAHNIYQLFIGCDIAGFNIENFDLPILVEEFLRCGFEFPPREARVIDAFKIFKVQEPRDLEAAYKYYCGGIIEKTKQHSADYDTLITLAVLQGQADKYKLDSVEALIAASRFEGEPERVDYAGKLARRADGTVIYNFGPGKGNAIKEDLGFGNWMLRQNWLTRDTRKKLKALMEE